VRIGGHRRKIRFCLCRSANGPFGTTTQPLLPLVAAGQNAKVVP
jgi:hypothetical protein